MKGMTREELCREFAEACRLAGFNPAKDTLADTVERLNERKLRHLLLCIENGGLLLICADPEMSRRVRDALEAINAEYEKSDQNSDGGADIGIAAFSFPGPDAPQSEFNGFFRELERSIGGNA